LSTSAGDTVDVEEAIRTRRSIRKWSGEPLDRETIERLLESVRLAPSGMNGQRWELIVVTDRERLQQLVPICNNQAHVGEAGAFVFIVTDPSAKWVHVDPAIAMDHLTLRAREMGLGTCWIGAFDETRMREFLGIPGDKVMVIGMTLGHPGEDPGPRTRRGLEELIHWERY
jgi:nitroreductase